MVVDETCELLSLDLPKAESLREGLLTVEALEPAANGAKALSDPTRVRIALALLDGEELCVCDLACGSERQDELVSYHLRQLKGSASARSRKDGRMVLCSLTDRGRNGCRSTGSSTTGPRAWTSPRARQKPDLRVPCGAVSQRRPLLLNLSLALLAPACVLVALMLGGQEALAVVPLLVCALPLLAGRYLGERQVERLARWVQRRHAPARRRRPAPLAVVVRRTAVIVPRGGLLIAGSLAVRPPPARRSVVLP